MSNLVKKLCGIVLLWMTLGLASCQALWVEMPGAALLTGLQG